jgi:uncharacterized protein involved in propanediol utilization
MRTGIAEIPAHHGEILQGIFTVNGRPKKGLVTLPFDACTACARFTVLDSEEISVSPSWRRKAKRAAELTIASLRKYGIEAGGGRLEVMSEVPVGKGFGSSTADVLASIVAVANAFGVEMPAVTAGRIAVAAETASDSLMFQGNSVLFAHRDGELIEDFGADLPRSRVVGFFARCDTDMIDTLALAPIPYSARDAEVFDELRLDLRRSIATGNAALLGKVATASAEINQRYLPIPDFDRIRAIADTAGATGVQVSHSGTIAGLLFDSAERDVARRVETSKKMLEDAGFSENWEFGTGTLERDAR